MASAAIVGEKASHLSESAEANILLLFERWKKMVV